MAGGRGVASPFGVQGAAGGVQGPRGGGGLRCIPLCMLGDKEPSGGAEPPWGGCVTPPPPHGLGYRDSMGGSRSWRGAQGPQGRMLGPQRGRRDPIKGGSRTRGGGVRDPGEVGAQGPGEGSGTPEGGEDPMGLCWAPGGVQGPRGGGGLEGVTLPPQLQGAVIPWGTGGGGRGGNLPCTPRFWEAHGSTGGLSAGAGLAPLPRRPPLPGCHPPEEPAESVR